MLLWWRLSPAAQFTGAQGSSGGLQCCEMIGVGAVPQTS